jgi:hypothetical protein
VALLLYSVTTVGSASAGKYELELELTLFHGHLIVHTEGVLSVQTAYPQAAVSGAIS